METSGYLTTAQVARRLGVSAELVRQWLRQGRVEYVQTALGRLIPLREVERIASQRQARKGGKHGDVTDQAD